MRRLHQVQHLVDHDVFEALPWLLRQLGVQPDAAGAQPLESGDTAQDGGLAAPAWPEQAADRAARQREIQPTHHFLAVIAMVQTLDREQSHARIIGQAEQESFLLE